MESDDGLARAGPTADDRRAAGGCADGFVLFLLDRRHDAVHRRVTCAAEAGQQRALTDDHEVIGRVLGIQQVVFDSDDLVAGTAQHPSADDAGRILRGRLIENSCRRGAPVDEQDVPILVADADPADVARLAVEQVQPAEDQPVVRGVERRQPSRRLVDHRVALDEATLIADVATGEALRDQRLGHLGRFFESAVDDVDVGLLDGKLVSFDFGRCQRTPQGHRELTILCRRI